METRNQPNRHAIIQPLLQVVKDVKVRRYGCKHGSFSKIDSWAQKLENLVMTRGTTYLYVDLPDIGKAYDCGLSRGYFRFDAIPNSLGGAKAHQGWFFDQLLAETFGEDGTLCDVDAEVVFLTRTLLYLYKKTTIPCPPQNVRKAADDFFEIEAHLRDPSGTWNHDVWIPCRFTFAEEPELRASHSRGRKLWSIADKVFGCIVPQSEVRLSDIVPRHGPGAVADQKTGEDKYVFPSWPHKLGAVFQDHEFCAHNLDAFGQLRSLNLSPKEPPARLIAVPKTYKAPRLIASEPVSHQFMQQGLMNWIRQHLTKPVQQSYCYDSQEPSRDAALLASVDGEMATVDLSSASDRLTCWAVERAFGSNQSLLQALHAVRTRCVTDATEKCNDLDRRTVRLRKFAAQGSAVTFPIQTIVYIGLCLTALAFVDNVCLDRKQRTRTLATLGRKVRVFGDDLIVPKRAVPVLSLLLQELQLKVNGHKTHYTGRFRESCGMDAFKGHDVTPCYLTTWRLDASPSEFSSWCDVSNNAHRKGLWHLSSWMLDQIPPKWGRRLAITNEEGDGYRLFTFNHGFVTDRQTPTRWNEHLHRWECQLLSEKATVKKKRRGSLQDVYQYFVDTPSPESHWTAGYLTRKTSEFRKVWVPIP
jgi:hypothetical protein